MSLSRIELRHHKDGPDTPRTPRVRRPSSSSARAAARDLLEGSLSDAALSRTARDLLAPNSPPPALGGRIRTLCGHTLTGQLVAAIADLLRRTRDDAFRESSRRTPQSYEDP